MYFINFILKIKNKFYNTIIYKKVNHRQRYKKSGPFKMETFSITPVKIDPT